VLIFFSHQPRKSYTINPNTVLLEGIAPTKWAINDVGSPVKCEEGCAPCECSKGSRDKYSDLILQFDARAISQLDKVESAEVNDFIPLTVTAEIDSENAIFGNDCIRIEK